MDSTQQPQFDHDPSNTFHYRWWIDQDTIKCETLPFEFDGSEIHLIEWHNILLSDIPNLLTRIKRMCDDDTTIHISVPTDNEYWTLGMLNALMVYHGFSIVSSNKSNDTINGVYGYSHV